MAPWMGLAVGLALLGILWLLRRPGAGGSVGRAIRSSDHWAWQCAVDDKRAELSALLAAEPTSDWSGK